MFGETRLGPAHVLAAMHEIIGSKPHSNPVQ